MTKFIDLSQTYINQLLHDDNEIVKFANINRNKLFGYPSQSQFRVYALLVILKSDNSYEVIQGANAEQGYIGGAICAERAALCQLRFYDNPHICKVVVVTDSLQPLSPGALCREFLISHVELDCPIIMGNDSGDKISKCTMKDLWPYPYIYRKQKRTDLLKYMEDNSLKFKDISSLNNDSANKLYLEAVAANSKDILDKIHPIRFSGAVLFEDGMICTSWQLKGLEYGCTLDPISQLLRDMERRKYCIPCNNSNVEITNQYIFFSKPVMIVMIDQFGITHAPFAQARSLLSEHGYEDIQVLVHDNAGEIQLCTIGSLLPQPPNTSLLSHDDFK